MIVGGQTEEPIRRKLKRALLEKTPCWKDACSRDSHDNSSLVEVRASSDKIVLVHRTLADKGRLDVLRSSTVRYRPTSSDLVADLSELTTH